MALAPHVATARKESRLFTVDLMLSLGAEDNPETRKTVQSFNNLVRFWSRENQMLAEKFINRVKSRVDSLARTLDHQSSNAKIKELTDKLQDYEARLKTSQTSTRTLQAKLSQLKQDLPNDQVLKNMVNSYKIKCRELVNLQDEHTRYSIWFSEKLRASALDKQQSDKRIAEIGREIETLKIAQIGNDIQTIQKQISSDVAAIDLYQEFTAKQEAKMKLLLGLPADDTEKKLCSVPANDGTLVLLRSVYASWKKDGVVELKDSIGILPPFRTHELKPIVLASLEQIQLVHTILKEFMPALEPPFKIQFQDGESWQDICFCDQLRIASVMFYMKSSKQTTNRRLVHHNRLLITITIEQEGVFKFQITDGDQNPIPSRLIVTDAEINLL